MCLASFDVPPTILQTQKGLCPVLCRPFAQKMVTSNGLQQPVDSSPEAPAAVASCTGNMPGFSTWMTSSKDAVLFPESCNILLPLKPFGKNSLLCNSSLPKKSSDLKVSSSKTSKSSGSPGTYIGMVWSKFHTGFRLLSTVCVLNFDSGFPGISTTQYGSEERVGMKSARLRPRALFKLMWTGHGAPKTGAIAAAGCATTAGPGAAVAVGAGGTGVPTGAASPTLTLRRPTPCPWWWLSASGRSPWKPRGNSWTLWSMAQPRGSWSLLASSKTVKVSESCPGEKSEMTCEKFQTGSDVPLSVCDLTFVWGLPVISQVQYGCLDPNQLPARRFLAPTMVTIKFIFGPPTISMPPIGPPAIGMPPISPPAIGMPPIGTPPIPMPPMCGQAAAGIPCAIMAPGTKLASVPGMAHIGSGPTCGNMSPDGRAGWPPLSAA